ncbi:hypothetical protein [Vibrio sonorensis]|uniref:hypothetical protein n=1 Tax=Vibrio sonorensis TaxID=1004316 RepID=UPI000A04A563|nr:hypothetical protein [Vibrio sonorensis]
MPAQHSNTTIAPVVPPAAVESTSAGFWPYLTALFAILWLATLTLWFRAHKQQPVKNKSAAVKNTSEIDNAVKSKDVVRLQYLINQWISANHQASAEQKQDILAAMEEINQAQFNHHKSEWNGKKLLKLIKSAEQERQPSNKQGALAKL